jgi:uncharacterized LabA/DUF88 family protein
MHQAFIDGQNLQLGTTKNGWKIDLAKFRRYLKEKYKVEEAYYFLGAVNENLNALYENIQKSGYILVFREHNSSMVGKKRGNVDTDIVFLIMKKLYKKELSGKVVLVSGDGDYKRLVDFLIAEQKFAKLLAPNSKNMSSLYRRLDNNFYSFLDTRDMKALLRYKK